MCPLPVLTGIGHSTNETVVEMVAAYNKITAPKEMALFPDFAHEHYPGFMDQAFQFMAGL